MRRRALLAGSPPRVATPGPCRAQSVGDWPKGPIRVVVPVPARRHDRSRGPHHRRQGE
jgi:hypothetical protein